MSVVSSRNSGALHSQSVNMEFVDGIKKRRSGRVVSRGAQMKTAKERTEKDMVDCCRVEGPNTKSPKNPNLKPTRETKG